VVVFNDRVAGREHTTPRPTVMGTPFVTGKVYPTANLSRLSVEMFEPSGGISQQIGRGAQSVQYRKK
jgi:hypothetical protein